MSSEVEASLTISEFNSAISCAGKSVAERVLVSDMNALRIILGLYQIAAAIITVIIMRPQLYSYGIWFAILVFLFCGFSLVSGAAVLAFPRLGWKLTTANQFIQLVGVFSPFVTFIVSEGLVLRPLVGLTNTDGSWPDARPTFGFFSRAGADFGFALFKTLEGFPDYGIAINLVALALTIVAVKALRASRPQPA